MKSIFSNTHSRHLQEMQMLQKDYVNRMVSEDTERQNLHKGAGK